jgi:dihydrofolate reductase
MGRTPPGRDGGGTGRARLPVGHDRYHPPPAECVHALPERVAHLLLTVPLADLGRDGQAHVVARSRRSSDATSVLQMGITLDGYVAGPGGEGDWGLAAEHPDVRAWKVASLRQVGTHIMGRVTYEQMAAHWPNSTGDYAEFMNSLPKVVFSRSLPSAEWAGSRIARGDLAAEIAALKTESGGEIMAHGGAAFVQALSRLGLIDEYPPGHPPRRPRQRAATVQGPGRAASSGSRRGQEFS